MNQNIKQNTQSNEPKENWEFGVYTNMDNFPISEQPDYLKEGIGGVCTAGSAIVQVADTPSELVPGGILILFPWQLVSIRDVSPDFRMTFFRVSQEMFSDTLSSLWVLRSGFFFFMRKKVVTKPNESYIARFQYFCNLLDYRQKHVPLNYRKESIMQLLRVFYWDVYIGYANDPAGKNTQYTRKEELAFKFLRMIIDEHSPNKEIGYYAERLNITPKYLTNLVRSISGHSAHDWIVRYTIIEIKALLREPSMDLKTIADRLNFPDLPTFSRFFRHYTGMTPSKYRKIIQAIQPET
ncbi:AraC family transcriptional regulator [Bacteroides thetaiotaomicron]|mgnify:FL=1|uniref:helix-turn-helix domain-containing protein n=1 Tax=Bacteroides TaxID=816 RepID=UPI0022E67B0C|nr:helix-turn-helix domain-containing protein [Bacteroides ovatus]UYI66016.1 MAG: helix-turn-helix domain-containing protein [Bacteroides ovatus]